MKKKCITCGEVKPFTDFHNQFSNECIICKNARSLRNNKKRWSTEIGFLAWKYSSIKNREKKHNDMSHRCCFTFKEFCGAFEEHKEKLKGAREKALEVRRKNANEKKEMKDLQKEEKELIKKSQIKKVNKLKEEVGIDIVVKESPEPKPPSEPLKGEPVSDGRLTKKDLEDAQLEAIIKYEMIRKQRKKEKYEKQKHEKEEAQVRETLMRAVAPQRNNYQSNNPFGNCY